MYSSRSPTISDCNCHSLGRRRISVASYVLVTGESRPNESHVFPKIVGDSDATGIQGSQLRTKALKLLFVSSETSSLSKMPSDQNNQCESECTPPQSQVETRNVENSCYDSLSPRADESSTPSGKPRRTGRSSSKEDQRRSTRERSPSPSWTRVGWALAPATKRSHSRQRPAPLGHALAQDLEEADSLKVNLSPPVAAHRGRRPSNAGPAALPEAASNEPQRPSAAGFNALLQALQI